MLSKPELSSWHVDLIDYKKKKAIHMHRVLTSARYVGGSAAVVLHMSSLLWATHSFTQQKLQFPMKVTDGCTPDRSIKGGQN